MSADKATRIQNLMRPMTISLFIILLSFFIMLNAGSTVVEEKKQAVFRSVQKSFGGKFDSDIENEGIYSLPMTELNNPVDFSEIEELYKTNKTPVNFIYDKNKSTVRIPVNLLFDKNETRLKPDNLQFMADVAQLIAQYNYPVDITVHSDDVPPEGTGFSNIELASLRALSVLTYFTDVQKLPVSRFMAYGWGEFRPAFSNQTAETRFLNRRVDISFVHKGTREKAENVFIFRNFFFRIFE